MTSHLERHREDIMTSELYDDQMEAVAVAASWRENGRFYWSRLPGNTCDLRNPNLDEAEHNEIPCPEEFLGKWVERMLEAPNPLPADCYIKKPQIWKYAVNAVAAELAEEARAVDPAGPHKVFDLARTKDDVVSAFQRDAIMYETLRFYPHDNIARYYGCIRQGDHHISGICLKRYDRTLCDDMHNKGKLDAERITEIIQGVRAGLEHLHSLGYAHNDVTPTNIMIDDDGHPVLIDFESCGKLGEVIGAKSRAETPGYVITPKPEKFEAENDFRMLDIIEDEMRGGKPPFSRA
ncbi:kinase-like domain-containing protein [Pisolithus albus]|nr:kinase-like domain-containing protein [Pisolithus albus]